MAKPSELLEKFVDELNNYTREAAGRSAEQLATGIKDIYERILTEGKAEIDRIYGADAENAKHAFERELVAAKEAYLDRLSKRKDDRKDSHKGGWKQMGRYAASALGGAALLGAAYLVWPSGEEPKKVQEINVGGSHGTVVERPDMYVFERVVGWDEYSTQDLDPKGAALYIDMRNGRGKVLRATFWYNTENWEKLKEEIKRKMNLDRAPTKREVADYLKGRFKMRVNLAGYKQSEERLSFDATSFVDFDD